MVLAIERSGLTALAIAVKTRRIAKGLTQQQVSERTNGALTKSAISMIESGTTTDPGVMKVIALAKAYECRVGDLVETAENAAAVLSSRASNDPLKVERQIQLLQFWDELSEDQQPAALEIMKVLATVRQPKTLGRYDAPAQS